MPSLDKPEEQAHPKVLEYPGLPTAVSFMKAVCASPNPLPQSSRPAKLQQHQEATAAAWDGSWHGTHSTAC